MVDWSMRIGRTVKPACFASRTAASVRTNLPGTSFIVRTNFAIGACIVPTSFASSSSRDGSAASAAISFGGHHLARHRAAGDHELLVALGEVVQHLRHGHRVAADAVRQRADHLVGQRRERRVGDRAAHEGVLDHPEVHARSARLRASCVMSRDGHAAVLGQHDGLRAATCFATSATTASFCLQIETQAHLHASRADASRAASRPRLR